MPLQLVSEPRQEANRANAQKSSGPKTPEGKAAVSGHALQHGLCAANFVILTEDVNDFNGYRQSYMGRLGPRDGVEIDLIDRMVHAGWTERRTWSMENDTIDLQLKRMAPSLAGEIFDPTPGERAARAIEELAKQPTLPLLHRYAARLSNEFQRALKTLLELRERVPLVPPGTPIQDPVAQASACGTEEPCQTKPIPESDTTPDGPQPAAQSNPANNEPAKPAANQPSTPAILDFHPRNTALESNGPHLQPITAATKANPPQAW
jgi:hypothetical protein